MNPKRLSLLIAAGLVLAFVAISPQRWINRAWQDALAKWAPSFDPSGEVVVVAIDDAAIAKFGTWPWNRNQTAKLFSAIAKSNPKVLVFDGWFPHRPEPFPGDSALSDTLRSLTESGLKVILPLEFRAPTNIPSPDDSVPVEIPEILKTSAFQLLPNKPSSDQLPLLRSREVLFSDTMYQQWSSPSGFITSSADPEDDVFRHIGHVLKLGDEYFPSLAVAILAAYGDANLAEVSFAPGKIQVRETVIPVDEIGQTPLRFLGRSPSVPQIDADKLLADPSAFRERIQGKIILVGVTSSAALNRESGDFFRTPISDRFPGVEIWAVGLENILQDRIPRRPAWARLWELLLAASLIGVVWFLANKRPATQLAWTTLGVGSVLVLTLQVLVDRAASVHTALDLPLMGALFAMAGMRLFQPQPKASPMALSLPGSQAGMGGQSVGTMGSLGQIGTVGSNTRPIPDDGVQRIGKYEIVAELGRGAMGVVHKGYDRSLDRHVAIKIITAARRLGEKQDESSARFQREARAIAALNHPSIVTIYESDDWEGSSFIAMEFLNGQSLEKVITEHRLSWKALRLWGLQLMEALAYAHGREVIHRDIKPANIMVVENGRRVKLTDFGLARRSDSSLTQEGQVLGTPFYMAPEQIDGRKADGRADQFSLGVVLYELVARRKPYEGEDVRQIMLAILLHPHPPLASLAQQDIPPEAIVIIERMMSKEVDNRYASLDEATEAWRRIPS